jgi:carbonic anhydrase
MIRSSNLARVVFSFFAKIACDVMTSSAADALAASSSGRIPIVPASAPIDRLFAGFKAFRSRYYEHRPELFESLKTCQTPRVMVIGCADSRVDPAILTQSEPGELFVVRNVANIVPPYEPDDRHHGTSAALEFAVRDLGVGDIVVLGHSQCGGIQALAHGFGEPTSERDFIGPWISVVRSACARAHGGTETSDAATDLADVEQAAIGVSLDNLMTYPWIRTRVVDDGNLSLHGWWFDLHAGSLWTLDPDSQRFLPK